MSESSSIGDPPICASSGQRRAYRCQPFQRAQDLRLIARQVPHEDVGVPYFLKGPELLCSMSVAACAPRPATISPDTSAISARKLAIDEQFQKDWERCVDVSYRVIQQQTADKNAAAEQAFASCTTEEAQMNSLHDPSINALVMPHFKAEAKRLLVERGHISASSVQAK
jgi:hypothetical protein